MAEGLIGYARCEELLKKIKETNAELKGLELSLSLSDEEWEQLSAQEWYADIKKRLDDETVKPYYADGVPYQVEVVLRFAR